MLVKAHQSGGSCGISVKKQNQSDLLLNQVWTLGAIHTWYPIFEVILDQPTYPNLLYPVLSSLPKIWYPILANLPTYPMIGYVDGPPVIDDFKFDNQKAFHDWHQGPG